jgi:hypothetical protein
MQTFIRWAAAATLAMISAGVFAAGHEGSNGHKEVAVGWFNASCGELDQFKAYIEKHMADDGVSIPARYVGLGFQLDSNPEDEMRVEMVTPGTPASKVLKKGDVFVSVNGVPSTYENRDKMTFRGKPGEPVPAVIVIEAMNNKERVLEGLGIADADNWPTDSCSLVEVVAEGNVVYLYGKWNDTESETGYKFKGQGISRFEFNEAGQVSKVWGLVESRFVLEQLGYTITR